MKILTVCDQGNNRSVQFAHLLKYKYKADVLSMGIDNTSDETKNMLFEWADYIIVTEESQLYKIPAVIRVKCRLWDVGEDRYPRPFNKELLAIVRQYIAENPLN